MPKPGINTHIQVATPQVSSRASVDVPSRTTLSLAELLAFAYEHAPGIQTAQARIGLAHANVVGAEIAFPKNPQLSVGAGGRFVQGKTGLELEVAIEQRLEVAGQQALRLEAAQDQQRLREAAFNESQWRVHIDVRRFFFALLLARERVVQARRFIAFAESMRDIATHRVDAGESSPLIMVVADTDLAQARTVLALAQQQQESLKARLISCVGWPTDTLPDVRGHLPEVRRVSDIESLLESMAMHHPSLRTRERAVIAGRSKLALEERESWPDPTVGLSYGREPAPGSDVEAHIIMFSLNWPLSTWHTNQEERARAEAELIVADRSRDEAAKLLRGELKQAVATLEAAVEQVVLYEDTIVPRLERNLSLLERAYELGEIDVHQVSQIRGRLLMAMDQYIDARVTYYDSVVTLEGLVGTKLQLNKGGSL